MRIAMTLIYCGSVMTAVGQGDPKKLVPGIQDISWSPDSKQFYYTAMWHLKDYSDFKPQNWSVYRYNLDDKKSEKIVESAMYVSASPSGKEIAVGKLEKGNRDIYVFDEHGKNPRRITAHPKNDLPASWTLDGKSIVFNSDRDGKNEIYLMRLDSSEFRRLTHGDGVSSNRPQLSPDGKQIIFYSSEDRVKDQIYLMNTDGTNQKKLIQDTLMNIYPSWINDHEILYMKTGKTRKAMVYDLKTMKSRQLLDISTFFARVSPNRKMIAYIDNGHNIQVISIKGDSIQTVRLPD